MKYLHDFPREMVRFQEVGAARLEQLAVKSESNLFRYQVLFRSCSAEFLDCMTPLLRRKFFFADQVIIKEGTESTEMFAIGQGRAVVERKGKRVGNVEAGLSLGEMAVLGLAPESQTLTVRAEVLCDMQVLSRNEFEPLLLEFPAERARLLDVAAQMMREDLAEVSNLEILTEVPILQEVDMQLIARLNRVVVISVCRKGELLFQPGDTSFFVLLQGSAEVEVEGAPGRPLTEGDTFGEIALLGLTENGNIGVRASRTCLLMGFPQKGFHAAVEKCGARCRTQLQVLVAKLTDSQGMRHKAIERCPVLLSLKLSEERLLELPSRCEEVVFTTEQEIVSKHLRSEVLLFMVAGKASVGTGKDAITLEAGSSLGELTAEPVRGHHSSGIFAMAPSKVLLLHRKAFLAFVETWPGAEREQLHARLEHKKNPQKALQDTRVSILALSLRQRAQNLAEQCISAAKSSVEASASRSTRLKPMRAAAQGRGKKMWKMAKLTMMMKGTLQDLNDDVRTKGPAEEDGLGGESCGVSRQNSEAAPSQAEASQTMASSSASFRSLRSRTRLTVEDKRRAAAQEQEGLLLRDRQRLVEEAKRAAAAAKQEQVQLRREAEELRRKLNAADHHVQAKRNSMGFMSEDDGGSCWEGEDPGSALSSPHKPPIDFGSFPSSPRKVPTELGSLPSSPRKVPTDSGSSSFQSSPQKLPTDQGSVPSTPRKPFTTLALAALTPRQNDLGGGGRSGACTPRAGNTVAGNAVDAEAAQVELAERRLERLQAKLVQACQRREDLLQQLQQRSGVACC